MSRAEGIIEVKGATQITKRGLPAGRHGLEAGIGDNLSEPIPAESDISLLDVLFDETLDPNDSFWNEIGMSQDELSEMVAAGRMPFKVSFETLVERVQAIAVVDEADQENTE